jgi:transcriptional regulator with XRE-family HTH domain
METEMNLGDSIRKIRLAKGISQGEMQKRTGILRSYLSRVENGHTVPSFATLQRLAGAMGVTLSDFFALDGTLLSSDGAGDPSAGYLLELKSLLPQLSPDQRQQLLETVKQMARTRKV